MPSYRTEVAHPYGRSWLDEGMKRMDEA